MDSLVTTECLSQHLHDPDVVVLDCSVNQDTHHDGSIKNVSGRNEYEKGHIPSAGFADLMVDLSDTDKPIEFAVPSPEKFCEAMGELGVGDESKVVLYDSGMSMWAARVWWMLRWVGFDQAAILDGGLLAWKAEDRPLSTEQATPQKRALTPRARPELIADRDEVFASIDDKSTCLIDTLPSEFYRGEVTLYARPGHITGAKNISGMDILDETGRYRSNAELAELFNGDRGARNITYCGGGIMASGTAFVMHRLGFTDVAVYTASMQEWAADPDNPMAVETAPKSN